MAQRMTFGLFSGAASQRIEFVRMKGPRGTIVILSNSSIDYSLPLSRGKNLLHSFTRTRSSSTFSRQRARGDGCDEAEGFRRGDTDLRARLLRHGFPVGRRLGRRRGVVHVSASTKAVRPQRQSEQFRPRWLENETGHGCDEGQVGERGSGLDGERTERNRSRRRPRR